MADRLTDEELISIQARLDKLTNYFTDCGAGYDIQEEHTLAFMCASDIPPLLAHIRAQDAELARLREALTNLCDAVTETREKLLADVLAAARQGMDALNGRPLGSVKVVGPEGAEVESVRDDGNKANCDWTNLLACCQRCHLHIQGRWQPGGVLPPEWGVPEWVTERGLAYRQVVQHALFEEG